MHSSLGQLLAAILSVVLLHKTVTKLYCQWFHTVSFSMYSLDSEPQHITILLTCQ